MEQGNGYSEKELEGDYVGSGEPAAKILVADDSAINRRAVQESFKDENYIVTEVSNGEQAVERALYEPVLYAPGRFMLAAKNSKYYPELTRRMLVNVLHTFHDRPEGVSINLSALDIRHTSTREFVLETLWNNQELARRLTVEILEQEGVDQYDRFVDFLQEVKSTGARVALDDFGSGYSNLMRVLTLQADYLKIDGSLIRDVTYDPVKASLVEFIVSFSSIAKLEVVAEFVENAETMEWLRDLGVRYSQGYHIGRPVPAAELPAPFRGG